MKKDARVTKLRRLEVARTNSVGHADSVEKILGQISMLSPDEVVYQAHPWEGQRRERAPKTLGAAVDRVIVSASIFRKFICTAGCTACCQKFTLDYIPSEIKLLEGVKSGFVVRKVYVNGKRKEIWSNDQNPNPLCDFLTVIRPDGGLGCARWPQPPLACISAPQLQFIQMRPGSTYVLKKPFGRAWAMKPTPQCQFIPCEVSEMDLESNLAILARFRAWARYFGIKTCLREVEGAIRNVIRSGHVPVEGIVVWERGSS